MPERRVAIVTDSTADLPRRVAEAGAISVVPLTLSLDGRSYLDGIEIEPDGFYKLLEGARGTPTTSQPPPQKFVAVYRRLLDKHEKVVSVHISARLSGTFASAEQAAAEVGGCRILVIDSGAASMALGISVLVANQVAAAGGSAEEVSEAVAKVGRARRTLFAVGTLEYLRRGGRIGRAGALLGSVLQIKPVLTLEHGEVAPLERVRTSQRAVARIIELARQVDTGEGIRAIVGHAANAAGAGRLAEALEPQAGKVLVQPLGPVIGAHAGPGTVGLACYPAQVFPLDLDSIRRAAADPG
ncbi:MAG: DegV family protein [Candidatus Dormibacteraceae bacterium]